MRGDAIKQCLRDIDRGEFAIFEAGGQLSHGHRMQSHHSITLGTRYRPSVTDAAFSW